MSYELEIKEQAIKALKHIDRNQAKIIMGWINKNLVGCSNPRLHGKPLIGNKKGYWRYRVGVYRIIADIDDGLVRICVINIAHRSDIYRIS